jgi:hypothetical protein
VGEQVWLPCGDNSCAVALCGDVLAEPRGGDHAVLDRQGHRVVSDSDCHAARPSIGRSGKPVPNQVPTTPGFAGLSETSLDAVIALTCRNRIQSDAVRRNRHASHAGRPSARARGRVRDDTVGRRYGKLTQVGE